MKDAHELIEQIEAERLEAGRCIREAAKHNANVGRLLERLRVATGDEKAIKRKERREERKQREAEWRVRREAMEEKLREEREQSEQRDREHEEYMERMRSDREQSNPFEDIFSELRSRMPPWAEFGFSVRPSRGEFEAAYRKRATQLHPDHGGDASAFAEMQNKADRCRAALVSVTD